MRKLNLSILLLAAACMTAGKAGAQATIAGNTYAPSAYLGWVNNGPLPFKTNNKLRIWLNGDRTATISGIPTVTDGFLGLGPNNIVSGTPNGIWTDRGPYSLLHLHSGVGGFAQETGWRPWMRYGITSTHNQDFMFIGQRATNGPDSTDAVFSWADNDGEDNMVFSFTSGDASVAVQNPLNGDLTGTGNFGREIMRMNPNGNIGIGPRFTNRFQPQSNLHLHQQTSTSSWMQITNQFMTQATPLLYAPTPIAFTNGFRWGILGNANKLQNGNAYVYNQENRHLIFSTNHAVPTDPVASNERLRITAYGSPMDDGSSFNPANLSGAALDNTRVSISHSPSAPVTQPMSLLHLGYNIGGGPGAYGGWRPWMDVGMSISQDSDNMYIGLKDEGANRKDAVLAWGDDGAATPDMFRIIFSAFNNGVTGTMQSNDGLEFARFVPNNNATLNVNDPRIGFGDFKTLNANPQNTIHINTPYPANYPNGATQAPGFNPPTGHSGLRFQDLTAFSEPQQNPGGNVLSVNTSGDVILVPAVIGSGGSGLGNICGANPNPLASDWEIPLKGHNFIFSGNYAGNTTNNVGIGTNCSPAAKLDILQQSGTAGSVAVNVVNNDDRSIGVKSYIGAGNTNANCTAGFFEARSLEVGKGVQGYAESFPSTTGGSNINYGGYFEAHNGDENIGVYATASATSGGSVAGYFNGNVFTTGSYLPSDKNLKRDINKMESALPLINELKPVTYYFDTDAHKNINLQKEKQYGFISQEVQEILPELTKEIHHPAKFDKEGKKIAPGEDILGLNYNCFIAILTKGMQEQQKQIAVLEERLAKMEQLLAAAPKTPVEQTAARERRVDLADKHIVVLDQNVPNPFAESTTITYNIPEKFGYAQITFSTVDGKIMKTVDIKETGAGQLNVFANDLSSGIYTYSLVIDGKVMGTKKMVKSK